MGRQDGVSGIRYNKVFVLTITLMHVSYSMHFFYLLLFVNYQLSLEKALGSAHVSQPECDALHLR